MQLSSIIQSFLALAAVVPSVLATPVAVSSSLEERGDITARSYTGTCKQCNVDWQGYLKCQCTKKDKKDVSSSLYLNKCLVNIDGIAHWRLNGGAFNSIGCIVDGYQHPLIQISCRSISGDPKTTVLNLDEKIHNIDGQLQCHV